MIMQRILALAVVAFATLFSCRSAIAGQLQSGGGGSQLQSGGATSTESLFKMLRKPNNAVSGPVQGGAGIGGLEERYGGAHAGALERLPRLQPHSPTDGDNKVGEVINAGDQSGPGSNGDELTIGPPPNHAQQAQPGDGQCGNPPQIALQGYSLLKYPLTPKSHLGMDSPNNIFYYFAPAYKDAGSAFHSATEARAAWTKQPTMLSIPGSDVDFHLACKGFVYKAADELFQPTRQARMAAAAQQQQAQTAGNAAADAAEMNFAEDISEFMDSLINVANEDAATPGGVDQPTKQLPQAIWMVQQMFHNVYIPMAILLLLPGAMMTHMKSMIQYGMLGGAPEDEEMRSSSPFTAIFRSLIAIFLIPATQLIVSWMIDIGNSMTYEVTKYITSTDDIIKWSREQTFNPPPGNAHNNFDDQEQPDQDQDPPSAAAQPDPQDNGNGSPGQVQKNARGKNTGYPEGETGQEDQSALASYMQAGFNIGNFSLGSAITVLIAFQIVTMCYLFLLGPIAAAFYAWPSGIGSLFKKVLINWVDAVMNLSLWRFWWCVVILIMYIRINWLKSLGEYYPNSQWEMAMYTAFMVILAYVPFMPFEFRPGEMVSKVLEKAEQASKGGGGGGGGDEGKESPTGPSTGPGQNNLPAHTNGQEGGGTSHHGQGAAPPAPPPPSSTSPAAGEMYAMYQSDERSSEDGGEDEHAPESHTEPPPVTV